MTWGKIIALGLLSTLTLPAAPLGAQPVRLATEAFGEPVRVEVRDLGSEDATAAARSAIEAILVTERLTDPSAPVGSPEEESRGSGALGVAALHAADGGPLTIDPRLLSLLQRAQSFCRWSDGAFGPLGGNLYLAWESAPEPPPAPETLTAALATTLCRHLHIDAESGQVALLSGARLDLRHFALGAAVDRAVEVLQERGAANGFVQIGPVRRGFGEGPSGRGWRVLLPVFPGYRRPLDEIWLRDQAVAVARGSDGPHAYLDLQTGRPQDGIVGVVTVTRTGLDAQGLAASLFVLGPRQGRFRVGQLRPAPSVLWLLGSGEGRPLQTDHRWSAVHAN